MEQRSIEADRLSRHSYLSHQGQRHQKGSCDFPHIGSSIQGDLRVPQHVQSIRLVAGTIKRMRTSTGFKIDLETVLKQNDVDTIQQSHFMPHVEEALLNLDAIPESVSSCTPTSGNGMSTVELLYDTLMALGRSD